MTDAIKHIDLDDEQYEDAPKALRDYAAKLKKALADEQTKATGFQKQLASKALGDVLGDKGFANPKRVEKALLADDVDPLDATAVEAWLSENSEDFAKAAASDETPPPVEQNLTPEQEAAAAAFAKLQSTQGSLRQPADMSKLDLAKSEITDDMTSKQVREVMIRHGL